MFFYFYIEDTGRYCNEEKNLKQEDFIYYVTFDVIVAVIEIIDGYSYNELSLELIDRLSGENIGYGIELHDTVTDFLKD